MPTVTPENVTSWRGLADELTADQIQELERTEREADYDGTLGPEEKLLSCARRYARDNLIAQVAGEVALPPGVTTADRWEDNDQQPYRFVFGVTREITDGTAWVSTSAAQWADGSLDTDGRIEVPHIAVVDDNDLLNSKQARELAAALLAAADEIDGWAR